MMILFQFRQSLVSRVRTRSVAVVTNQNIASIRNTSTSSSPSSSSARAPSTETSATVTSETAVTAEPAVRTSLNPAVVKPITDKRRTGMSHTRRDTSGKAEGPSAGQLFIHAGLPLIAFSLLAAWVLKNSIEGKNKEYETSKGQVSKSQRQARMEEEHQDMLEKLNKIRHTDFDNTKRIERPEEILERRRREREARNVWYRRWGRWITGQS